MASGVLSVSDTGLSIHTHTHTRYNSSLDPSSFHVIAHSLKSVKSALSPPGWRKRLLSLTLCATVILTAALTELILCEIAKCLPMHVRSVAMRATMMMLLVILVLLTPALEIHTVVSSMLMKHEADWNAMRSSKKRFMVLIEGLGMLGWLVGYWSIGNVLSLGSQDQSGAKGRQSIVEGYLICTGVIGICLMASLAGFAAVSSVWQTFGHKERPVSFI